VGESFVAIDKNERAESLAERGKTEYKEGWRKPQ
jgi:hypothetical protein